jgi:uncharacterized repeat protein (TIGR01451 family)
MKKLNLKKILSVLSCAVLLAGCAQQQQQGKYKAAPASTAAAPKAGSTSAYFPSGKVEGSGLLLEKTAPAEVLAGQPYQYSYKVSNLTDATLENVVVSDRVGSDFAATDSDPKAATMTGGNATWTLGSLGPKESKTITVSGSSPDEGVVTTCGSATYNPIACQDIHVVKANIALTKTEPADETLCDPIPVTLDVKNTGSSALTGVQIADTLPAGMTSDGKSALTFDIGNLAPGESKEVKYNAAASATGKLVNTAKVTSTQGVTADATATTTVHQPVLAVTCKAPDQQFMGRKFDVCYTVNNTGDAPAAGATLAVTVPAGLTVAGTTGNGQVKDSTIVYDLGSIDAGASQNVCATFVSATAGTYAFAGTTKGTCAAAASTSCETKVVGVPAILLEKSDNPDPVAVGDTTTYTVKITNQGSADDSNVQVVVLIAPELAPVSSSAGTIDGQTVTLPVVPTLAAGQQVTYTVLAKGVKPGDGHTKFTLSSDMLTSPISAEESTHVY